MIRLAHVVTHPIQYFAPLYRELAVSEAISLTVLFGSRHGIEPSFDKGFGQTIQFNVPLLGGYEYHFLENRGSGVPSGKSDSFDCPAIATWIQTARFDAVWIHGWAHRFHRQAIRACQRAGIPYLIRGETNLINAAKYSPRWILRKLRMGHLAKSAAACLYIGQANREFYRSIGIAENRLFPAHYAVDAGRFRLNGSSSQKKQTRKNIGTTNDSFVIATLAKVVARKRVEDVIRAVAALPVGSELWVLGDGDERHRLERLARQLAPQRVRWLGFVNQAEIPGVLSAANAFVLASDDEPWGLVVNEAMACGLPIVVSDRCGCAPDLVHEGVTGYLYPTGNVPALAEILRRLQSNPAAARIMGQAACDLATSQFDVKTTANQIAAAAKHVVGQKPASQE